MDDNFEKMMPLDTGDGHEVNVWINSAEPNLYTLKIVDKSSIYSLVTVSPANLKLFGEWLVATALELQNARELESTIKIRSLTGREFVFERFAFGYRCPALKVEIHYNRIKNGFQAFRGNEDAISPQRCARNATPHYFQSPSDAATASVTIWENR